MKESIQGDIMVPPDIMFKKDLPPSARLVYAALFTHTLERTAPPRLETIAKELGTNTKIVSRALKILERKGLIQIFEKDGRMYYVLFREDTKPTGPQGETK